MQEYFQNLTIKIMDLLKINKSDFDKSIKKFKLIYVILITLFQVLIMISIATIFNVLGLFIIIVFWYSIVRNSKKRTPLHFEKFDLCFKWSNVLFIPMIITLSILQSFNYNLIPFAIFYIIVNALTLSEAK